VWYFSSYARSTADFSRSLRVWIARTGNCTPATSATPRGSLTIVACQPSGLRLHERMNTRRSATITQTAMIR
jgi:hypothetical protein